MFLSLSLSLSVRVCFVFVSYKAGSFTNWFVLSIGFRMHYFVCTIEWIFSPLVAVLDNELDFFYRSF